MFTHLSSLQRTRQGNSIVKISLAIDLKELLQAIPMMLESILLPLMTTSLFALLGLYVRGQYRSWAMACRRSAWDSGCGTKVRLLLHVTTQDRQACAACREAHGTVFLPLLTANKGFSTLRHPCMNPKGCRCLVVGLHGGWPTANRLVETLRRHSRTKPLKLEDQEILNLFEWPWRRRNSALTDQIAIQMVHALHLEGTDPEAAIPLYRDVVDRAKSDRDLRMVVPAYRRLEVLLRQVGRAREAQEVVQQFERCSSAKMQVTYQPKTHQRANRPEEKSHLPGSAEAAQPSAPSLALQGHGKQARRDFWR